jgi:hypothetical protein
VNPVEPAHHALNLSNGFEKIMSIFTHAIAFLAHAKYPIQDSLMFVGFHTDGVREGNCCGVTSRINALCNEKNGDKSCRLTFSW